jgi:amino-acid N-acetyltransferase
VTGGQNSLDSARESDWEQLVGLLASSGLPAEGLEEHLPTTLVVREGGRILGSVALEMYGSDALLRSLAVSAECRGRGLGRRLAVSALDLAGSLGAARVYLLTETAASFFRRIGFRDVPRSDVPERLRGSLEFASLCPLAAEVLMLSLSERSPSREARL